MNERIKELAEQANIEFTYDPTKVPMRAFVEAWEDEFEKFAELLINKCAETVQDFVDHRFPASEYPVRLRRYFGVEE
jgi:hypothetical protein